MIPCPAGSVLCRARSPSRWDSQSRKSDLELLPVPLKGDPGSAEGVGMPDHHPALPSGGDKLLFGGSWHPSEPRDGHGRAGELRPRGAAPQLGHRWGVDDFLFLI